jgi:uncharacterized protein (DUF1800 family)
MKALLLACLAAAIVVAVNPLTRAQSARLANISTRGQVGADADNLFGGFVISGGAKTVLVRAVGPGLAAFGVPGTLPDPTLTVFDARNTVVASNDNWNAANVGTFGQVGAFPLPVDSRDAVVVATLQPGGYTAQISGLGSPNTGLPAEGSAKEGVAILEVYDVSGGGQLINIATRLQVGSGANAAVAGFVVAPGSGTRKLLIRGIGPALGDFGLQGFLPDPKLTVFDSDNQVIAQAVANGSVSTLASATAQAGAFGSSAGDAATIVTVSPGSYTVQLSGNSGATSGVGLIEVYDITTSTGTPANLSTGTTVLYYAALRPTGAAATSTASGYATIVIDPNTNMATVSIAMSGLSSAQNAAHLVIGSAGSGNFVLNLPRGQVAGIPWTFPATGPFSTTALLTALKGGQLFVSVDTAKYPGGELQGGFVLTTGSSSFVAPAAPPALPAGALTAPTQTDAARLLMQATFGPTKADIDSVAARGITTWLDEQLALPATSLHALLLADVTEFPNPPPPPGAINASQRYTTPFNLNAAWWKLAATSPDQLRQRVAFALSEIFVVGKGIVSIDNEPQAKARYYDLLVNGAFGNFRTLLEQVSLSPPMGVWLSHLANPKADPIKGTSPDENYAREIMQLFSIGLVQLQPDGTLLLDANGQPIPAYNQDMITEVAKVFTGWSWAAWFSPTTVKQFDFVAQPIPDFALKRPDDYPWLVPMRIYEDFHDRTEKRVISLQQVSPETAARTVIPANQTGPQDLKIFLDALASHPNVGPFICRRLIQFLVTSNPSAGYVYRVAQVFNQQRSSPAQLGAVVHAILTDYEARSPDVLGNPGYGKIKEPLIRLIGMFRALSIRAPNGRYMDSYFLDPRGGANAYLPSGILVYPNANFGLSQEPLGALTVFNFFAPDYAPPGAISAAGLVAPEMQTSDSLYAMRIPTNLFQFLTRDVSTLVPPPTGASPFLVPDFSALLPNARNSAALADQVNLLFCANQLTAANRTVLINALNGIAGSATDLELVQTAVQFVLVAPDGVVQR